MKDSDPIMHFPNMQAICILYAHSNMKHTTIRSAHMMRKQVESKSYKTHTSSILSKCHS